MNAFDMITKYVADHTPREMYDSDGYYRSHGMMMILVWRDAVEWNYFWASWVGWRLCGRVGRTGTISESNFLIGNFEKVTYRI